VLSVFLSGLGIGIVEVILSFFYLGILGFIGGLVR
jgi:hypothetical protein